MEYLFPSFLVRIKVKSVTIKTHDIKTGSGGVVSVYSSELVKEGKSGTLGKNHHVLDFDADSLVVSLNI